MSKSGLLGFVFEFELVERKGIGTMADTFTSNGKVVSDRGRTHGDQEDPKVAKKVDFVYEGDKMCIPGDMSMEDTREAISRQNDE